MSSVAEARLCSCARHEAVARAVPAAAAAVREQHEATGADGEEVARERGGSDGNAHLGSRRERRCRRHGEMVSLSRPAPFLSGKRSVVHNRRMLSPHPGGQDESAVCRSRSSKPLQRKHARRCPSSRAVATLNPTAGNSVTGTVVFVQEGVHVKVEARVSGLTPGMHGFHVHEKGDCSAPDAESAGGHFNPTGQPHGDPRAPGHHHAGDMPMLTADPSGNATLTMVLSAMSIGRGPADIVGKSVVVHAGADDYRTQPAGNSGARVACAVIRSASG